MSEPDIRLQIRIKNARILRAMKAAGIATIADLCRMIGVNNQSFVGEIINFKRKPIDKGGQWRPVAMEIATALHVEPEILWPEYLREIAAKKTETEIDVTVEQFAALTGGEQSILDHDRTKQLLAILPPREATVIEMRFGLNGNGEHTFEEVAKELDVTRERVRQIEIRALRRMADKARVTA